MGLIVAVVIMGLSFFTDTIIKKRFNTPPRGWYKHEKKVFAVINYIILLMFVIFIILTEDIHPFYVFPFVMFVVNTLFGIEKYLYKRGNLLYIHYFVDSFFWLLVGIAVSLL